MLIHWFSDAFVGLLFIIYEFMVQIAKKCTDVFILIQKDKTLHQSNSNTLLSTKHSMLSAIHVLNFCV
jgi:hypothetical protein